jgi:hypothetical protein
MDSTGYLLLTLLFSSVGMGYTLYGRKQHKPSALLAGVALMAYPYVVKGLFALTGLGLLFCAIPFLFEF